MTIPFAVPTPCAFAPLRPLADRLTDLRDMLRRMPDPTPFAVLNAVHSCDLTVYEVKDAALVRMVTEARKQRENSNG